MKLWHRLLIAGLAMVALATALAVAMTLVAPVARVSQANGTTIYVDADATGGENNGTSWDDAFTDLQDGLTAAVAGTEIWVAEGTYKPSVEYGGTGDRYKSFQMKNGVTIYGGFDPDAGATEFENRDWASNVTILSGDLNGDDGPDFANNGENSYHVFYHPDGTDLDSTAILDGFTISGGNADGEGEDDNGGGMYNHASSPVLTNCTFVGNSASEVNGDNAYDNGGGMYNNDSSPVLTNCIFVGNSAGSGGGMANFWSSAPTLTNCVFADNLADYYGGGGMLNLASSPTLVDCTFLNNSAHGNGGGIFNDGASPSLHGCRFSGNSATNHGGGMANWSSSSTLTDCTFEGNKARDGGGMGDGLSSVTLTHCTFSENSANNYGGGMYSYGSAPTLAGCLFEGNEAPQGGGMYSAISGPTLTNCTFWGNSGEYGGGGVYNDDSSSPALTNCILWSNSPDQISAEGSSTPAVTYSDVQGGYAGEGNIDEPPLFMDVDNGDFHLQHESPCIDVGDNDAPDLPEYDFEGDVRVLDGDGDGTVTVDMGVDEVRRIHYVDAEATGAGNGSSWQDAFTDLQDGLDIAETGDEIWVAEGTYTPTAEHGGSGDRYRSFQLRNGVTLYGGFDPSEGDVGLWDRDWVVHETIVSGDLDGDDGPDFENNEENSFHIFYHPDGAGLDGTAILDGFTITGGNANGAYPHHRGGGIYNYSSAPTLTNCTFEGNSASYGGAGMLNNSSSSPALTNCTFSNNWASWGSGMYNSDSAPALTNCTFKGNWADYGAGMFNSDSTPALTNCTFSGNSATILGGGMYNALSSPMLTNCTFEGNSADNGGGMYNYNGSSPVLTNSILWGDTPDEMVNDNSSPVVSYSDVQGGCEAIPENVCGAGNIDADPLFVDAANGDFHLGAGSPCIDVGNNAAPNLPDHDFEGDARIVDCDGDGTPTVDMGVDEVLLRVHLPLVLKGY